MLYTSRKNTTIVLQVHSITQKVLDRDLAPIPREILKKENIKPEA